MAFTNHTKETIKKTQDSYYEAVSKAIDMFGKLGRAGSGYTYWIGDSMEAMGAYNNIKKANSCSIRIGELFDFRNPKIIQKSYHIYKSTMFQVTLYWKHPFTVYHHEDGVVSFDPETNEKKKEKEAYIGENKQTLSVKVCSRSFGIKDFMEDPQKIKDWLEKAEDEELKGELMDGFVETQLKIDEWRTALKEASDEALAV